MAQKYRYNGSPDYPGPFQSATIVLPVMNETVSLEQTVEIILRDIRPWLREILIVVCDRTTPEAMAVVNRLSAELGDLVVVHHQKLPFLGGALRECYALARGSHTVLMASDLETEPNDLGKLIEQARKTPWAIVATSRWLKRGSFSGYSRAKLVFNWMFQMFFSALYGTRLTDLTFGYRVYPTPVIQSIVWEELRHPFLFECMVKPLRLGVPVVEVTTTWRARIEGESQNPFFRNFVYLRTGLRTRFSSTDAILLPDAPLTRLQEVHS
ncbi:MAG TPA: glycosyltransferase family 2 protein [Acidobacteriaceae bacterium]|nr:glycosyltransferase family 2 protein [Acidobacteriaceae bacterium]